MDVDEALPCEPLDVGDKGRAASVPPPSSNNDTIGKRAGCRRQQKRKAPEDADADRVAAGEPKGRRSRKRKASQNADADGFAVGKPQGRRQRKRKAPEDADSDRAAVGKPKGRRQRKRKLTEDADDDRVAFEKPKARRQRKRKAPEDADADRVAKVTKVAARSSLSQSSPLGDLCTKCSPPRRFKRLRYHMQNAHPEPGSSSLGGLCTECSPPKWFKQLRHHIRNAHSGVAHPCPHEGCDKKFSQVSGLRRHLKSVHSTVAHVDKKFVCSTCGLSFSRSDSLKRHMKNLPADHSALDRSPLHISATDCTSDAIFCGQEEVLQQVAVHNTSYDAADKISESLTFRPSSSVSEYDGFSESAADNKTSQSSPSRTSNTSSSLSGNPFRNEGQSSDLLLQCSYFHVFPKSDQVLYPVSLFPRNLPAGTLTLAIHYDLDYLTRAVESGTAKLYHMATTPSQRGAKIRRAYQTHVVISTDAESEEYLSRSESGAVLLNPRENRVFFLSNDTGPPRWHAATKVRESDGSTRRTQLILAFANGLRLDEGSFSVHPSWKMRCVTENSTTYFACPACVERFEMLVDFRDHFRAKHMLVEAAIRCTHPTCDSTFRTIQARQRHLSVMHERQRFPCSFPDCQKEFTSAQYRRMHEDAVHKGVRALKCPHCPNSYAWHKLLRKHMDATHKDITSAE